MLKTFPERTPFVLVCGIALLVGLFVAGCDDDDGVGPGEDETMFDVEVANVSAPHPVLKSGAVASPGGPDSGPAIFPGETATFSFTAPANTVPGSGMRLNLATMFVQSNDLFYAFAPEGLALFEEDGTPVTGDVTDQLFLYDAGTEADQEPGVGDVQKPRQSGPNTGDAEDETVELVADAATNDFEYPDKTEVIQVTIEHDGGTQFTVSVTNVSTMTTLQTSEGGKPVPLSPFAWAVHTDGFALYQTGEAASRGIEWIAEDGFPADQLGGTDLPPDEGTADVVAEQTGLIIPLSPPAYAVHEEGFQAFTTGDAAPQGIELIAEDGFPADQLGGTDLPPDEGLVDALQDEDAVSTVGAVAAPGGNVPALEPAPGGQGESVTFTVSAAPGDRLSLFTMFVQSNDLFYAFAPEGLPLFDAGGSPVSGDVTAQVLLWDAGTEVDEEPGVGPTQKPRQAPTDVNVGPDEDEPVSRIDNAPTNDFTYPPANQVIRVTITPQQ